MTSRQIGFNSITICGCIGHVWSVLSKAVIYYYYYYCYYYYHHHHYYNNGNNFLALLFLHLSCSRDW